MQANKKSLSIWIIFCIMVGSLLIPTTAVAGKMSSGSTIAGISIEDMSTEEAMQKLQTAINNWQAGEPLVAKNEHESITIPRNIFQFDLDTTFLHIEEKMKRHWSNYFMKQKDVQQELIVTISTDAEELLNLPAYIDVETTLNHALVQARNLSEQSLALVHMEDVEIEQEEIATVILPISEQSEATIDYLIENIDGVIVQPNVLFSFLESMTLPNGMGNAEQEMSFLATGLYQLILQIDFEIIERHSQETVANYTEAGLDAAIDREGNHDLQFYHVANHTYTIQAAIEDENMKLSIHAIGSESAYEYSVENEVEIEPRKLYHYNNELLPDEEYVIQEGQSGQQVEVYRISKEQNGTEIDKQLISRDFYAPIPEIIERAAVQIEESESEVMTEIAGQNTGAVDLSSIVNQFDSSVATSNLACEEDPNFCEESDENLLALLFACMLEKTETPNETTEEPTEEIVEVEQKQTACDLLLFFMFLGMLDGEEAIPTEELPLQDEEILNELKNQELEIEEEEEEEAECTEEEVK